jgi:hypothetical protein
MFDLRVLQQQMLQLSIVAVMHEDYNNKDFD